MRFQIESARIPFPRPIWDELVQLHLCFLEAFARLKPPPSPEKLARQAAHLSLIYNDLSPEISYNRPEHAEARLHFFMPTDIPKIWGPVNELAKLLDLRERTDLSVLDLGAGAGTASVGIILLLAALGYKGKLNLTLVEPDKAVARHLHTSLNAAAQVASVPVSSKIHAENIEDYLSRGKDRGVDLVVAMNVLTEALDHETYEADAPALLGRLLRHHVKPEGFVTVVEPALKRCARRLARAEAAWVLEHGAPTAPCLASGPCPQLATTGKFCFHASRVPLTPLLQSACARSNLERHEVNYSYLTVSRSKQLLELPEVLEGQCVGRVVSFPRRIKKGFNYFVCTPQGIVQGFARRILSDGETKGGKLPHGTLVVLSGGA